MRDVDEGTWREAVEASPLPVVVEFTAPWCAPCRAIEPALERLEERYAGRARFVRLDVDASPALAARLGVLSLPTVSLFERGAAVASVEGRRGEAAYGRLLAERLG